MLIHLLEVVMLSEGLNKTNDVRLLFIYCVLKLRKK